MTAHPPRTRNELWARTLMDELARAGVRHVVVAPGSRSTPLVLAVADDPRFRAVVQVDERSAGFLALGVGKGTGRPAAVITTSGTATANLLPAVVEAAQSETPLLILTADRPPRLRGADANQAIDQTRLFGSYARYFEELSPAEVSERTLRHLRVVADRAVAAAIGDPAGPVHLNLPFEKPLEPVSASGKEGGDDVGDDDWASLDTTDRADGAPFTRIHPRRVVPHDEVLDEIAELLIVARRPILVAGPAPRPFESGPEILALARELDVPLLADPLSGARATGVRTGASGARGGDTHPGVGYDLALRDPEVRRALAPHIVLRFGATPSSASLATWLDELRDVPQVVVDGGGRWKDHLAAASEVVPGDPTRVAAGIRERIARDGEPAGRAMNGAASAAADARSEWTSIWREIDDIVRDAVAPALASDFFEGAAAVRAALAAAATPRGILFTSNSMPVRDVDALVPVGMPRGADDGATVPEEPSLLRILGNRGASGIDGIVSTAIGVAWGTGAPVTALIGDLALIHDMNGLLGIRDVEADAPGARVDFIVVNNDGGGIFHLLPVRDFEPHFTRFVATPHGLEPRAIAALHGLPFHRVEGRGGGGGDAREAGAREAGANETGAREARAHGSEAPQARASEAVAAGIARLRAEAGSAILEVRTDREENRARHAEVVEQVRVAIHAGITETRVPETRIPERPAPASTPAGADRVTD